MAITNRSEIENIKNMFNLFSMGLQTALQDNSTIHVDPNHNFIINRENTVPLLQQTHLLVEQILVALDELDTRITNLENP